MRILVAVDAMPMVMLDRMLPGRAGRDVVGHIRASISMRAT